MRVFLIHGMGRTPASMWGLAMRLRMAGHWPSTFGYMVTLENLEAIGERFLSHVEDALIADRADGEPYAVVGHSLGSIVTRLVSPQLPEGFRKFIMLAPPNHPPAIARALRGNPIFRAVTRDAGSKLTDADFYDRLPVPEVPSLIIAGNRGPRVSWLPFGDEPHDAVVGVDETRLGEIPVIQVPAIHTFLMNRADVFAHIRSFLAEESR